MGFLEGKTVIVTGGGRAVLEDGTCGSIGYGIVTAFAKEGANIVITGRNLKKLEDAKEEIERLYNVEVLAEHTTEQFDLAMYSGLYAAFYYMKACYPYLKETKGSVINFASGAGLFGNKGQCSYAAAKEGIRGLTRVAATEWAADGINVNVVCPLAWTAQLEKFEKAYPEAFKANVHTPPMGHFGDNEKEIGRVVVQLTSPDFKYMTGETITLEGGLGMRP